MGEEKKGSPLVAIIFIIVIIVAWGIIGNAQSKKSGASCNIGLSKFGLSFCWTWHSSTSDTGGLKDLIKGFKENINDTKDSLSSTG